VKTAIETMDRQLSGDGDGGEPVFMLPQACKPSGKCRPSLVDSGICRSDLRSTLDEGQ
jgi:hypothetical protein